MDPRQLGRRLAGGGATQGQVVWRESPSGSEGNIEADWGTIQGPGMTWGTIQGGWEITQGTTRDHSEDPGQPEA